MALRAPVSVEIPLTSRKSVLKLLVLAIPVLVIVTLPVDPLTLIPVPAATLVTGTASVVPSPIAV